MERFKYFISLGANYQEGIHRNSGNNYSQINFRSNIDGKISENIKINFDLSGRQSITNRPADMYNPLYSNQLVVQSRPNMPARWPNGLPGPGVESDLNPVVSSSKDMGYDKFKSYVFGGLLKLDINIPFIRGLTLSGNLAVDKTFNNNKKWSIPYYLYYWGGYNENNEPQLIKTKHGVKQPELTQSMADAGSITLNGLINYNNTFKDHTVSALVGVEKSTSDNMNFNASRKYFPSQEIDQLFAGGDFEKDNGGSASQSARLNYFGRVNYNYMSKYLAEFVFRYDGSYIFQKDYRFGFFPGVSLGWIVSGEKFWKENNPVTYLKLRGSWGQTGNDRISPYQYLATYGFRTDWKNKYIFNINEETTTLKELRIPYEEITWEVANQTNIGIDMQMFHGRFSLTVEYFHNLRKKILEYRNASVPLSTGLTLPRENIGKVKNQGFEIQLSYNHTIGDFSYSIAPNLSFATNKIIFWDETPNVEDYRKSTGRPIGAGLYYQAIGFFRDQAHIDSYPHLPSAKPGDIIFEDYNKDGKIDGLDQVRSKNSSVPKYFGGLNINLAYKNFYTSIFFQGAAGYDYYLTLITGSPESNYYKFITENRWTEENNTNASMPRAAILARGGRVYWSEQANTFFLRKGNYLRLKSMEVGYSIPKNMIHKIGIKELNVYISGMNLFTLTKLPKGFDPERSNSTLWPLNKVYSVGFKLTF
jgi:TonB-linked SusC/RagA family outer membrane protein